SVTPNIGAQGQQGLSVTITGAYFVAGATAVTFGRGTAGITVVPGSVVVTSSSSITATLNIAQTTLADNYDVVVTVYGVPATFAGGFTVAVPVPTDNEPITVNDQVTVTPLVINFAPPAAFFSASTLGFARGVVQALTVSNVGGAPLTFSGGRRMITTVSGTFTVTQTLCYDGTTTFPAMLPSGGACTLTISYTASSPPPNNDSGTIVFTDNAALSSPASMGTGPNYTQSITLSGTGATMAGQPPSGTVTVPLITEMITVNDVVGSVPSMTTLTSSNASANAGTAITLTATVQPTTAGNPSPIGTVTFFDGQTALTRTSSSPNPVPLLNGTASYATSSLAAGIDPLTAVYSGDLYFSGSTSPVLVETISQVGSFSVSASSESLTIQQGQSGSTTITIIPVVGFQAMLSLSCPTLPSYASCTFTLGTGTMPVTSVNLDGSGKTVQIVLTIYTTGLNGVRGAGGPPAGWLDWQKMRRGSMPPMLPAAVLWLIGMLALVARRGNEKKLLRRLALLVLVAGLGMLPACSNYGTPPLPGIPFTPTGSSTAVISVSGGGATQMLNLTVIITPER